MDPHRTEPYLATQEDDAGVWVEERQQNAAAGVQLLKCEGLPEAVLSRGRRAVTHMAVWIQNRSYPNAFRVWFTQDNQRLVISPIKDVRCFFFQTFKVSY